VIYPSLQAFVKAWSGTLRYNWDPERVPTVTLADFCEKLGDPITLKGPGIVDGTGKTFDFACKVRNYPISSRPIPFHATPLLFFSFYSTPFHTTPSFLYSIPLILTSSFSFFFLLFFFFLVVVVVLPFRLRLKLLPLILRRLWATMWFAISI